LFKYFTGADQSLFYLIIVYIQGSGLAQGLAQGSGRGRKQGKLCAECICPPQPVGEFYKFKISISV